VRLDNGVGRAKGVAMELKPNDSFACVHCFRPASAAARDKRSLEDLLEVPLDLLENEVCLEGALFRGGGADLYKRLGVERVFGTFTKASFLLPPEDPP